MKRRPPDPTDETRAEIARRRLAQLAASFDAELPPLNEPESEVSRPRRTVELPHVRVLGTVAVAASVLLFWWLLSGRPETSEPVTPLALPATTASAPASPGAPAARTGTTDLIIDVIGKVRRPGIVTVPKGSRVYQAIEAAGGLRGKADTASLNMARVLADGEQILVGIEPVTVPGSAPGAPLGSPAGAKINLNTATAEQLDTLPGVGPVTAKSILDWRTENGPFGSVDDLLDVKGIGDATLAELRDLVAV